MTLDEIWRSHRSDMRLVAYKPNTADYVSLACKTPDLALANALITDAAYRTADDWEVGEIVSDQFTGQAKDVINSGNRGTRDRVHNWGPDRAKGPSRFAAQDAAAAAEYETRRRAAENDFNAKVAELKAEREAREAERQAAIQAARAGGK